jgi:hypothetical protein
MLFYATKENTELQ